MLKHNRTIKNLILLCTVIITCGIFTVPCNAEEVINPDSGYYIGIFDEADLLTDSEEELLMLQMEDISEYGHVALVTVDYNPYGDTENYCEYYYKDLYGRDSGTILMIDMQERYIYIYSDGYVYRVITKGKALTITDNVYTYASDEDYYACASEAFSQINTLLEGGSISQPMKYICNALLSLIIGCTITYIIVRGVHSKKAAKERDILTSIFAKTEINNPRSIFINQTRVYDPPRSSRSGGGGGGGGGHSF